MRSKSAGTFKLFFVLIGILSLGARLSAGETLLSAWEGELRIIPAVQLTKSENFETKPQFSGRGELQAGFVLSNRRGIEYSLRLAGGYHLMRASTLDGGYSYNGFIGTYGGILIGAEGFISPEAGDNRLIWRGSAGILGEWAQYTNTYNRFFFPVVRLEGGLGYRLLSFRDGKMELILNAGIPLEWNFRHDTAINLAAGLHLGVSFRMGGRK